MPELPEIETVRCALQPIIEGAHIVSYWQSNKTMRLNQAPQRATLATVLIGKQIKAVARRGKNMLWFFEEEDKKAEAGVLLIHLGMSGKIYWRNSADKNIQPEKHEHWRINFADVKNTLCYVDARRFGGIRFFENYDEVEKTLAHGPEPLAEILHSEMENITAKLNAKFNDKYLFAKIAKSSQPIKVWLMDTHNVAGIGNIYACEVLFLAKVNPTRAAKSVSLSECKLLVRAVRQVLKKAIKAGGSTLRDYRRVDGKTGSFQDDFQVYDRAKKNCYVCKNEVQRIVQTGRATYYCNVCQK